MRNGFSLVELSIVLVILGLLTGGILGGQSLIRAAELRSVTTEQARYLTAVQSFRDKYFALPGDMSNATSFWGISTACSGASATGTCNGDGNGLLAFGTSSGGATSEPFQAWRQMASAGLIEGTYTGLSGAGGGSDYVPGSNVPASKFPRGGWGIWSVSYYAGNGNHYQYQYGSGFGFGAYMSNAWPRSPLLKPEELWNLDMKMDDGKPGAGKVIAVDSNGFATATACTTSASQTDYAGNYNLTNSAPACAILFANQY